MRTMVVGVDGSEGGQLALASALRLAQATGAQLRVVHACARRPADIPETYLADAVAFEQDLEGARRRGEQILDEALEAANGQRSGVPVEREILCDERPAEALRRRARDVDAEMLVVGSRGLGGFSGLLLGSVSQQCVQHAPCPVLVVPPDDRSG